MTDRTIKRLKKTLNNIAKGMIGTGGPSLELSPPEFQSQMWSWSQRQARAALDHCERCDGTGSIDAPVSGSDPSCPECDGEGVMHERPAP
ncbi:hypothetical protein LCGC14_0961950 [marine sediment metagenome]|uniref:Molecular chaperone DnaJ n=1 Tax=marine sediment metagenome TaxID=412755 RepID=A0A0F9RKS6_9ZZZZ